MSARACVFVCLGGSSSSSGSVCRALTLCRQTRELCLNFVAGSFVYRDVPRARRGLRNSTNSLLRRCSECVFFIRFLLVLLSCVSIHCPARIDSQSSETNPLGHRRESNHFLRINEEESSHTHKHTRASKRARTYTSNELQDTSGKSSSGVRSARAQSCFSRVRVLNICFARP